MPPLSFTRYDGRQVIIKKNVTPHPVIPSEARHPERSEGSPVDEYRVSRLVRGRWIILIDPASRVSRAAFTLQLFLPSSDQSKVKCGLPWFGMADMRSGIMTTKTYRHAITRTPPFSMACGITTQPEKVDVHLAREQHQQYIKTLQSLGIDVVVLDSIESLPDSHFVEDAAIIHNGIAILTRPGAPERRTEVQALRSVLCEQMKVVEIGGGEEALVDGGDVLFIDDHVFIGISYRTNLSGAGELKKIFNELDPALVAHFIPFSGVLHLKSGITSISHLTLLGNPAMTLPINLPVGTVNWLPAQEGYAANALTVNGATLYFEECHSVAGVVTQNGLTPIPMNMSEFRKMDGSFTCLSLLW